MTMVASELLSSLRRRGVDLTPAGPQIRINAPAGVLTDNDRRLIRVHKPALLAALLAMDEPSGERQPQKQWADSQVAAAADFVLLLTTSDLDILTPPLEIQNSEIQFSTWSKISNRRKFLASLQADVRLGPAGPRGRTGAIQADLLRLRTRLLTAAAEPAPAITLPAGPAAQPLIA